MIVERMALIDNIETETIVRESASCKDGAQFFMNMSDAADGKV